MDKSQKILSDVIIFQKYAKYKQGIQRRETWEEICDRNSSMHIKKYPMLAKEISDVYREYVYTKKVLPSMRSMQFAGRPIELNHTRIFNCAYAPVDHPFIFAEAMQLLLGGTGFGYSVQSHHIEKLPVIQGPSPKTRRFLVADSIEGWADAIKVLVKAYTTGKSNPEFDYGDIRHKGAQLITAGGKAPGPDPLRICVEQVRSILNNSLGRKLMSIECHDIMCHIADAVLSGGIRRAAMIAFFDRFDMDMISCKSGSWWELNPQRGRANNSAVLERDKITISQFNDLWERIKNSGSGEPGVYFTNDKNILSNPCVEATLNAFQFCNLSELNVSDLVSQEDFNSRAKAAAFIGTLQAGYTDFHYLRPQWKETTEKEALLGVGMTGIGSGVVLNYDMTEAAKFVVEENKRVASIIGINQAARTTLTKPSGTSSIVVGSSSGIHAWHNDYYIRTVRVGKSEPLYNYMVKHLSNLIEDCKFKPHLDAVMSFPQKAPEGSIMRTESAIHLLDRVKRVSEEWILPGHNSGTQTHNVSCTISVKPNEWWSVGAWMWDNRYNYNGVAVLPYDGGTYIQAPFQDCTKEVYDNMYQQLSDIDLTKVVEFNDNTNHVLEAACSAGGCSI